MRSWLPFGVGRQVGSEMESGRCQRTGARVGCVCVCVYLGAGVLEKMMKWSE